MRDQILSKIKSIISNNADIETREDEYNQVLRISSEQLDQIIEDIEPILEIFETNAKEDLVKYVEKEVDRIKNALKKH